MRTLALLFLCPLWAFADTGADVVVVYNSRMPESREVAEHYAKRRGVPTNQVWGLDVATTEAITRTEYLDKIQKPILKKLKDSQLWTWTPAETEARKLATAKVKYAALCYGVPTKFLQD